jgi:pantoate--beta-alanine ligase
LIKILKNKTDLDDFISHRVGTLAFVPTMGALHAGHLALVEEGFKRRNQVIVSIFVNPTQFAPNEDLDSYPRTLDDDIKKLEDLGVQALWLPSVQDIYPNGIETDIHIENISEVLEGAHRSHFFDGVATVVARLFDKVKPDVALFGEKDFQQLQVMRQMTKNLNLPIEIIGVDTVRDENGLALSSRNVYLSKKEYKIAIQLNKILKEMVQSGLDEAQTHKKLLDAGFNKIDYCTARNSESFETENPNRALAAVWVGKTRLIDNMAIE